MFFSSNFMYIHRRLTTYLWAYKFFLVFSFLCCKREVAWVFKRRVVFKIITKFAFGSRYLTYILKVGTKPQQLGTQFMYTIDGIHWWWNIICATAFMVNNDQMFVCLQTDSTGTGGKDGKLSITEKWSRLAETPWADESSRPQQAISKFSVWCCLINDPTQHTQRIMLLCCVLNIQAYWCVPDLLVRIAYTDSAVTKLPSTHSELNNWKTSLKWTKEGTNTERMCVCVWGGWGWFVPRRGGGMKIATCLSHHSLASLQQSVVK